MGHQRTCQDVTCCVHYSPLNIQVTAHGHAKCGARYSSRPRTANGSRIRSSKHFRRSILNMATNMSIAESGVPKLSHKVCCALFCTKHKPTWRPKLEGCMTVVLQVFSVRFHCSWCTFIAGTNKFFRLLHQIHLVLKFCSKHERQKQWRTTYKIVLTKLVRVKGVAKFKCLGTAVINQICFHVICVDTIQLRIFCFALSDQ